VGVEQAFSSYVLQFDGRPCSQSRDAIPPPPGVLPTAPPKLYHTEPLPPRRCPSYKGTDAAAPRGVTLVLLHRPVTSQIHGCIVGVQDIECRGELIGDNGDDEHPSCQWTPLQSPSLNLPSGWLGSPLIPSTECIVTAL
jgi:hypothetical protein